MIFYMPIGAIDMSIRGRSYVSVARRAHNGGYVYNVVNVKRENLWCCRKWCVAKVIIPGYLDIESQKARMK